MQFVDLTEKTESLTTTAREHMLALAMQQALGDVPAFQFSEPIHGTPRSGRLFTVLPHPRGEPIVLPLSARDIAFELMRLAPKARYDGGPKSDDDRKGWEVLKLTVEGRPAAIAWAAWTPH